MDLYSMHCEFLLSDHHGLVDLTKSDPPLVELRRYVDGGGAAVSLVTDVTDRSGGFIPAGTEFLVALASLELVDKDD